MLTDYHVHLRPDTLESTFERHMTAENMDRYRAAAEEAGIAELGVSEHIHRFTDALRIWDHPFWKANAVDDLGAYCDFVRGEPGVRLGVEMDFVPGREDRIAAVLDEHPWDYVIGSVHFLKYAALDWEEYDIWRERGSPEQVWREYFETLAAAASSGLYDIMAHPDLVKHWGDQRPRPQGDPRFFYEPAVEAFAEAGVAVEISTAGLRKPVGEIYPAPEFVSMCVDAGLDFTLSSDAHEPINVGYGYEIATAMMREAGVDRLCVFEGRERRYEPIG